MKPMRINKYLAEWSGLSRRKAESAVTEGRVSVNGKIILELSTLVDPDLDMVRLDGKLVNPVQEKLYLMFNKPVGVLTTMHDPGGRKTIAQFFEDVFPRVFPVGRLDYNSSGLILMTNDGALANFLTHPRYGIVKHYIAKVRGIPAEGKLNMLRRGIKLENGKTQPGRFRIIRKGKNVSWIEVEISEGKYRQIRKMFLSIGHPVQKLRRVGFAGLGLGGLPTGKWRPLTKKEILSLKAGFAGKDKGR